MCVWPYVWFSLMCVSFYFYEVHQIVPALGVLFLWFWWESLEFRRMAREFERLNPELVEEQKREQEALKIKWAIEKKEAKELAKANRTQDRRRAIEEFEKIYFNSKF